MAVVTVECIDGGRSGKRRACDAGATPVEEDTRGPLTAAELRGGLRACDGGDPGPTTRCRNTDQIEEAALRAGDHFARETIEGEAADESRHIRESCGRFAIAFRHRPFCARSVRWP